MATIRFDNNLLKEKQNSTVSAQSGFSVKETYTRARPVRHFECQCCKMLVS